MSGPFSSLGFGPGFLLDEPLGPHGIEPVLDGEAYGRQLQRLLPPGVLWNLEVNSTLTAFFTALAQELARVDARANSLMNESDPRTMTETLPEWEAMLALPDPCVSFSQSTAERARGVLAKYIAQGGQTVAYFIEIAAALGFTITITEFREASVEDDVETPMTGAPWAYAFQVNGPLVTIHEQTVEDDVEQPLRWWGNDALECIMRRLKPAHTSVVFSYS